MLTFLDGPAAGVKLMLHRAPVFLRVVRSPGGDWDALDQLTDEPAPDETITVYRRRDDLDRSRIHLLCGRGRNGSNATGWYWMASYSVLPDQPADADVRTTARWRKWAEAHAAQTEKRSP